MECFIHSAGGIVCLSPLLPVSLLSSLTLPSEKNKEPATSTSTATDAVAAPQNPGATKAKKPAAAH